jgi:hypothetical protein
MTQWLATLKGHTFDLEELSDRFASAKCYVKKDDDGYYYLRSSDFDQMSEPDAVHERALRLIELMKGLRSSTPEEAIGPSSSMRLLVLTTMGNATIILHCPLPLRGALA